VAILPQERPRVRGTESWIYNLWEMSLGQPQVGSKHATRRLTAFTNAPSYFFGYGGVAWAGSACAKASVLSLELAPVGPPAQNDGLAHLYAQSRCH